MQESLIQHDHMPGLYLILKPCNIVSHEVKYA